MIVKAAIGSDYMLLPSPNELAQFMRTYAGKVTPSFNGWSFNTYNIPLFTVKDQVYMGKTALKTRSFNTASDLMHSLKVGVSATTGEVLDVSKGLVMPVGRIGQNRLGYTANHIPQLYAIYQSGTKPLVCTGVYGNYDIQTSTFSGQLDFRALEDLWKE